MRFNLLARRITLAPTLAVVLALTVAACSSSSSTSAATSSAPASAPAASSPAPPEFGRPEQPEHRAARPPWQQITANWEKFFNSSTPAAEKVTLLQNGSKFAAAISALAKLPPGERDRSQGHRRDGELRHLGHRDLRHHGRAEHRRCPTRHGTAVYQDGTWKVGDVSLCGLFKLETGGTVPSACSSVG